MSDTIERPSSPAGARIGVKAVIEADVINHERLPMLEVVYDRMVRRLTTSMRKLTSDMIDVRLEAMTSIRFGDHIGRLTEPGMIGVFRIEERDSYGLVTVDCDLAYAVVDALLGGRRGPAAQPGGARGFTSIEIGLVSRMMELALADMVAALEPITPARIRLERVETSGRFVAIAGPTNLCAAASFHIDVGGRGGRFGVLLPYSTLEPIRHKLAQGFMGEKLGRDGLWEAHMEAELRRTEVTVDVVLGTRVLTLGGVRALAVGQTISLGRGPDDALELHCGGVPLGRAHIGQRCGNVAIRMADDISQGVPS